MKVYIDSDYRCHVTNPDGDFREVETVLFDGKSDSYIEGMRFVPEGESWTRSDGVVFEGEMIAPFVDSRVLEAYQEEYEQNRDEIERLQSAVVDAEEAQAAYEEGVQEA